MGTSLLHLPSELLSHIVSHFDSARSLFHFSLVCRRFLEYAEEDGWRILVQANFSSIKTLSPYWKDVARTLTTTSKLWDRKAFVARYLCPGDELVTLPHGRAASPPPSVRPSDRQFGVQSMGFQPVIDCSDVLTGSSWSSRREVLALGTGASLKLRIRDTEKEARERWVSWTEDGRSNGRDDITSLNILRRSQSGPAEETDRLIVGRASGVLEQVSISSNLEGSSCNTERYLVEATQYETGGRPVRSAHLSPSDLFAACLSEGTVALYDARVSPDNVQPLSEISVLEKSKASRSWKLRFLTRDLLAVGRGPSKLPITVHDVSRDGISNSPIRIFSTTFGDVASGESSVYSLMPLPSSSGSAESGLFLSGWYSGEIRLHDMRANADTVSSFLDPVDPSSAIYSLLSVGTERFVAGGARHSQIKVFDMRMPGTKRYFATNVEPCRERSVSDMTVGSSKLQSCCGYHRNSETRTRDFNIFLLNTSYGRPRGLSRSVIMKPHSPVYALGSGSPLSPTIYAGIENGIIQIDLVSAMDRHPDYMFEPKTPLSVPPQQGELRAWLDPREDVLSLGLVEHSKQGSFNLKAQREISHYSRPQYDGLDYRWFIDNEARAESWSRRSRRGNGRQHRR